MFLLPPCLTEVPGCDGSDPRRSHSSGTSRLGLSNVVEFAAIIHSSAVASSPAVAEQASVDHFPRSNFHWIYVSVLLYQAHSF
jgi:hypothetical protein